VKILQHGKEITRIDEFLAIPAAPQKTSKVASTGIDYSPT
jgi:hypothetical protein